MRRLGVGALLWLVSASAPAWGPLGHRTVAGLAQEQLTPQAKAQVEALLKPDNERTLVDVATWADELRDTDPDLFKRTNRLHYVDMHGAQCRYDPQRDCRGGACVVAAIDRYADVLGDPRAARADRAQALRFVVHFVADVHQPLHAGYRDDKGGNEVQLDYRREHWNLHAVWDGLLLNSTHRSWREYVDVLRADARPRAAQGTPAEWAQESCRIDRDEGVYPSGRRIGDDYLAAERPIAERRLREAGARLATLLNRVLH